MSMIRVKRTLCYGKEAISMNIPVGSKNVIHISGWAVVAAALIIDNTVTNLIRLRALKIVAETKEDKEEEISQ